MKIPKILSIAVFVSITLTSACSHKSTVMTISYEKSDPAIIQASVQTMASDPKNMMPKATAFTMSGDYADHVAVTINSAGQLTYFPAPSDITDNSKPVAIADGWYLNRQGIGANSVFTKWTFDEYKALKSAPSPSEIKDAIIPGAKVVGFITLPFTMSEASSLSPAELVKYLPIKN